MTANPAYIYPLRIDWPAVLADIKVAGLSYRKQAAALKVEWPSHQGTMNGHEPRYSHGEAILVLHRTWCGDEATQKRIADARPVLDENAFT